MRKRTGDRSPTSKLAQAARSRLGLVLVCASMVAAFVHAEPVTSPTTDEAVHVVRGLTWWTTPDTRMIRKERGVGPQANRTKAYVANSMCQITTSDLNVCGTAIYLHGNNPLIGGNERIYAKNNDYYDASMMDWPQSEEGLHDYEVDLPGGAT